MFFRYLRLEIRTEFAAQLKKAYATIENADEARLSEFVRWELGKSEGYKGTLEEQKTKALKAIVHKIRSNEEKAINHLSAIESTPDFKDGLIITVEWKPSRMWRSNPRAYTNFGFEGSSVGGCGYDKKSTAVAQALNSHYPLLKLLYKAKDKVIKEHKGEKITLTHNGEKIPKNEQQEKRTSDLNREFLGYGSGYGILPNFEGGVGVECHRNIIEKLGLKWEYITGTDNVDVYLIKKELKQNEH